MANKESKETTKKAPKVVDPYYKGYDIKWLKDIGDEHPHFNLVAAFESKHGEIK